MRERSFRENQVDPFLAELAEKNPVFAMSIQQLAIRGDPDKILCIRGRFVGLELKKDGEEPDPLQYWKLNEIKRAGGLGIWSRPDKWSQTKEVLFKLAKGKI